MCAESSEQSDATSRAPTQDTVRAIRQFCEMASDHIKKLWPIQREGVGKSDFSSPHEQNELENQICSMARRTNQQRGIFECHA